MSEADTSNNQPFPQLPALPESKDDSAANSPDAPDDAEDLQLVNPQELPELQDIELAPTVDVNNANELPDVLEQRSNDADWFALAQKMRQRNRRLLDQVTQLRQGLKEAQETLQLEQIRGRERETLLAQQSEELNTTQEQLTRLFQTLEASHQAAQRQQILIETLSEQLQSSQERVAQLERECALTQQSYNEQAHQLLQAANTCRELRTRLHRQQRQTLQFKAALEKSLEMSAANRFQSPQPPLRSLMGPQPPLVYKTQPIQPWSAEAEDLESEFNADPMWNRPLQIELLSNPYASPVEAWAVKRPEQTEQRATSTNTSDLTPTEPTKAEDITATELEFEQQLLAEMTSLAEASGLLESSLNQADAEALEIVPEEPEEPEESASPPGDAQLESRESDSEAQIWGEQLEEAPDIDEPDQANDVILPQSNWPSPVLYPLRPPKKRKSLAAIDLPSFPRPRPS